MREQTRYNEQKKQQHLSLIERAKRAVGRSSPPESPGQKTSTAPVRIEPIKGVRRPSAKPSGKRPIEQVLVGAWNAMKPENQGKAIMQAADRVVPSLSKIYTESGVGGAHRKMLEKSLGWTAVALEAGAIALLAAHGIKRGKKEPAWLAKVSGGERKRTSEHPNPMIRELDRLLKGEPLIHGDGVQLRTMVGKRKGDMQIAITAIEFDRIPIRDIRIDIVDVVKKLVGIFVIAEVEKRFACVRTEMPFTQMDSKSWPRMLPSDALRTGDMGSDTRMFPAGRDEMTAVAALLEQLTKDTGATVLRQDIFRALWER